MFERVVKIDGNNRRDVLVVEVRRKLTDHEEQKNPTAQKGVEDDSSYREARRLG